jgi:hypothetical protein
MSKFGEINLTSPVYEREIQSLVSRRGWAPKVYQFPLGAGSRWLSAEEYDAEKMNRCATHSARNGFSRTIVASREAPTLTIASRTPQSSRRRSR